MDPITYSRRPYTVQYKDINGKMQTIRRVPPEKLHDILPTDIVEITHQKNSDFTEGEKVKVKHINPRHPNILQLENDDGQTTFVDYFDVNLDEMVAPRDGVDPRDTPEKNKYLLWP